MRENLDEKTVIGVAKTKLDGKTLYLDILYGNRVILPDGRVSAIEPAIYERILKEYLKRPRTEEKAPSPAPAEPEKEESYFRTEEDFGIKAEAPTEEQEAKARKLREDKSSFFYRPEEAQEPEEETIPTGTAPAEEETIPTGTAPAAEETTPMETAPEDEAQLAADEEDEIPYTKLMSPVRKGRDTRLLWTLIGIIAALSLLLVLMKTGVI